MWGLSGSPGRCHIKVVHYIGIQTSRNNTMQAVVALYIGTHSRVALPSVGMRGCPPSLWPNEREVNLIIKEWFFFGLCYTVEVHIYHASNGGVHIAHATRHEPRALCGAFWFPIYVVPHQNCALCFQTSHKQLFGPHACGRWYVVLYRMITHVRRTLRFCVGPASSSSITLTQQERGTHLTNKEDYFWVVVRYVRRSIYYASKRGGGNIYILRVMNLGSCGGLKGFGDR